jgi:hypothetical protein
MERVFQEYPGPKREFINDFQTRGFSARTWELALFACLRERDYELEVTQGPPDFLVTDGGRKIAIEASTSNPRQELAAGAATPSSWDETEVSPSHVELTRAEFVFQMAKTLRAKVLKKDAAGRHYWELDTVAGRPFILAVQAFHAERSLFISSGALATYLYGYHHETSRTAAGRLRIAPVPVESHSFGGRTIPSAFFRQTEGQHVSAVLFSNAGTISQFQRIAVEVGLGEPRIRVIRSGTLFRQDPHIDRPGFFTYEAKEGERRETFAQGLTLIHNPWALLPAPRGLLRDIAELWLTDDNQVDGDYPRRYPLRR